MNRNRFVTLSLLAFGLVIASFLILGFGRLVLPFRTARLLAAPASLLAFALVCYLFVRSVLAATGLRKIDP